MVRETVKSFVIAVIVFGVAVIFSAFTSGCSHTQKGQAQVGPAADTVGDLQTGMRPVEQGCVMPPKMYEGQFYMFKETCSHIDGGPSGCSYMGKIALGTFWACGVTLMQKDCHAQFEPYRMMCMPFSNEAEILLNNLKEANEE